MKLVVTESPKSRVKEAVRECFASDSDLLQKWHIVAPASLDECVHKTIKDVEEFDVSFKFYVVYVSDLLAGYWGTEFGNYINLIFIKPFFRCKEFVTKFLKEIWDRMPDEFRTAVYEKNQPAVRFYTRLAYASCPLTALGYPIVYFSFRKEPICL